MISRPVLFALLGWGLPPYLTMDLPMSVAGMWISRSHRLLFLAGGFGGAHRHREQEQRVGQKTTSRRGLRPRRGAVAGVNGNHQIRGDRDGDKDEYGLGKCALLGIVMV